MSNELTPELESKMLNNCRALIEEKERLSKLSNEELVKECLQNPATDYPVVEEMMNRLWPGWADEETPPR